MSALFLYGLGNSVSGAAMIGASGLTMSQILFTGDSTVSQNSTLSYQVSTSSTQSISHYFRPVVWMDCLTSGGMSVETYHDLSDNKRKGNIAGVGGSSIPELLVRLTTGDLYSGGLPLLSRPEKYVWVSCGTNDINAGTSLATLIANMTAVIQAILAAGKVPILTTVLPRNSADGLFDWGTTGTTAAQKRLTLNSFNIWLVRYCRELNIRCVNWTNVFSDPATGEAKTGYTVEGVHPNDRGSYYLAVEALSQLKIIPNSQMGMQNAYDVFDATYNPYGNIYNGDFSGSNVSPGGQFVVGSGTGTVTGTLPDGFQIQKSTSTTTSIATSIVTRNGRRAIRLEWTSLGTGAASEEWRLNYWNGSSTTLASYGAPDNYVNSEAQIELEASPLGLMRGPQLRFSMNSGLQLTGTGISFSAVDNSINDSGNGLAIFKNSLAMNVAGTASNNTVYQIVSVTAGKIIVAPATPVVTEAAGASVTLRQPAASVNCGAVSSSVFPNDATGIIGLRTPVFKMPYTINVSPRLAFFTDGTVVGTAVAYVYLPYAGKLPFKPSVLNYTATDL